MVLKIPMTFNCYKTNSQTSLQHSITKKKHSVKSQTVWNTHKKTQLFQSEETHLCVNLCHTIVSPWVSRNWTYSTSSYGGCRGGWARSKGCRHGNYVFSCQVISQSETDAVSNMQTHMNRSLLQRRELLELSWTRCVELLNATRLSCSHPYYFTLVKRTIRQRVILSNAQYPLWRQPCHWTTWGSQSVQSQMDVQQQLQMRMQLDFVQAIKVALTCAGVHGIRTIAFDYYPNNRQIQIWILLVFISLKHAHDIHAPNTDSFLNFNF